MLNNRCKRLSSVKLAQSCRVCQCCLVVFFLLKSSKYGYLPWMTFGDYFPWTIVGQNNDNYLHQNKSYSNFQRLLPELWKIIAVGAFASLNSIKMYSYPCDLKWYKNVEFNCDYIQVSRYSHSGLPTFKQNSNFTHHVLDLFPFFLKNLTYISLRKSSEKITTFFLLVQTWKKMGWMYAFYMITNYCLLPTPAMITKTAL